MHPKDTVEVPLTQGKVALIDAEDAERVFALRWHFHHRPKRRTDYAAHSVYVPGGNPRLILLHRFILDAPDGVRVDHANRDGLDCRRTNLRYATNSQNCANTINCRKPRSGYRGVYRCGSKRRFYAYLRHEFLGAFDNPEDAARVWDQAAREFYGPFAVLNFPDDHEVHPPNT